MVGGRRARRRQMNVHSRSRRGPLRHESVGENPSQRSCAPPRVPDRGKYAHCRRRAPPPPMRPREPSDPIQSQRPLRRRMSRPTPTLSQRVRKFREARKLAGRQMNQRGRQSSAESVDICDQSRRVDILSESCRERSTSKRRLGGGFSAEFGGRGEGRAKFPQDTIEVVLCSEQT